VKKRDFRVAVGGDDRGFDLFARLQDDAGGPAVANLNVLDGCVDSNLGAVLAGGGGNRFGDSAHAAIDKPPDSTASADATHAVVKQDVGSAGRAGSAVGADHAVGGERDLHLLGLKPVVQKVGGGLRKYLDEGREIGGGKVAKAGGKFQPIDDRAPASGREGRRCFEQQGFDDAGQSLEVGFVAGERGGVVLGEFGDLGTGFGLILPHEQVAAVGVRRKERRIFGNDPVAMAFELKVTNNAFLEEAGKISGGGDTITGPYLLSYRATAEHLAPFEDESLQPGPGQIGGRDESVMAASDDDGIYFTGHRQTREGPGPRRA
jgi:hypothetical protein